MCVEYGHEETKNKEHFCPADAEIYSLCPKDNSDTTSEENHTQRFYFVECILKNSSVYPLGLDFQ